MPTREAIVDNIIPREIEKPIPVRTVSTRSMSRPPPSNINQLATNVEPTTAESVTPAESVTLAPQLSALARKEQAYRQREQALKERERVLESKLAEADQYSQLKTKFGNKDFSAAEELGLSYDEYTKYKLDKVNGEDPNQQAMKKLEEEIQTLKKGQEEKATKEYEETVAAYKQEIAKLVDTSDAFQKTKKAGKQDAVLQLILDSWEEDGETLSVEQAAKDVETYLIEEAKKWASLIEPDAPKVEEAKLPMPKVQTLTQHMQPSGETKRPAKSLQHMSDTERYEEARRRVLARRQTEGR